MHRFTPRDTTETVVPVAPVSGAVRFRITIELETVEAICHADARHAAQRVGEAIDQLNCLRPGLEDRALVEVLRVKIERVCELT